MTEWQRGAQGWQVLPGEIVRLPEQEEETWKACVLGLKDYVRRTAFRVWCWGFRAVLILLLLLPWRLMRWGLSGCIA